MRNFVILFCAAIGVLATGATVLAESAAGLKWTAPAGWKSEGERPMRAATYTIALVSGDAGAAECGVYFFGPGQGGSVEANLDRWKGQVIGTDGKPAPAQTQKRTIHGLSVTTLDSSGSYTGMGGPMSQGQTKQAGYRLLAAVVEGPSGNIFIKFAGPAKTIAANQQKYEQLLNSFERGK
jgi:hypothetical protein